MAVRDGEPSDSLVVDAAAGRRSRRRTPSCRAARGTAPTRSPARPSHPHTRSNCRRPCRPPRDPGRRATRCAS